MARERIIREYYKLQSDYTKIVRRNQSSMKRLLATPFFEKIDITVTFNLPEVQEPKMFFQSLLSLMRSLTSEELNKPLEKLLKAPSVARSIKRRNLVIDAEPTAEFSIDASSPDPDDWGGAINLFADDAASDRIRSELAVALLESDRKPCGFNISFTFVSPEELFTQYLHFIRREGKKKITASVIGEWYDYIFYNELKTQILAELVALIDQKIVQPLIVLGMTPKTSVEETAENDQLVASLTEKYTENIPFYRSSLKLLKATDLVSKNLTPPCAYSWVTARDADLLNELFEDSKNAEDLVRRMSEHLGVEFTTYGIDVPLLAYQLAEFRRRLDFEKELLVLRSLTEKEEKD
jgi:hypothetical protein